MDVGICGGVGGGVVGGDGGGGLNTYDAKNHFVRENLNRLSILRFSY